MSQEPKQVIVIRSDLKTKNGSKLPKGKEGAQIAHAAMAFLTRRLGAPLPWEAERLDGGIPNYLVAKFTQIEIDWINGSFRKIVLVAHDEAELLEVYEKARKSQGNNPHGRLETHLITDSGYTCFAEPTNTCVGIGPDLPEKIDAITGHLKLR